MFTFLHTKCKLTVVIFGLESKRQEKFSMLEIIASIQTRNYRLSQYQVLLFFKAFVSYLKRSEVA